MVFALAAGPSMAQSVDYDWQGFYAGAFAAGAFFDVEISDLTDNLTNDAPPVNAIVPAGGINFGYNWTPRADNLLLGLELEFQGGHTTEAIVRSNVAGTSGLRFENTIESITTLRGRVGMVTDNFLIYMSGGPSWATVDYSTMLMNAAFAPDCTVTGVICAETKEELLGINYGIGMEYAFRDNATLRFELVQVDLPIAAAEILNGAVTPICSRAGADDCAGFYNTEITQIQFGVNFNF
jgi:opacity protein-like surface antigen